MHSCSSVIAVFKRELKSYFQSPVAYVFMVVFLVMLGSLTFMWPTFSLYERGVADLGPQFFWLPLVFLVLVPAATMGLWSEERRSGTIELLLTMPVTLLDAILGKFLAAWLFIAIGVVLTFPVIITIAYLGDPDMGVVACGYVGALLLAGAYVSVGMLTSALTRSQVVSFVLSVLMCLVFVLAGTPFITNFFIRWLPSVVVDSIAALSFWSHFQAIQRGVIDIRDIAYYASVMILMVFASHVVLENRKSA